MYAATLTFIGVCVTVVCITAVVCSIIFAGGINRAAFYLGEALKMRDTFSLVLDAVIASAKLNENKEDAEESKRNIINIEDAIERMRNDQGKKPS